MPRRNRPMKSIRLFVLCAAIAAIVAAAWPAHAEINMWEDEEGVLILDSRRAPREHDALVISDYEIKPKPMPENVSVEEFRRLYQRSASLLKQVAADFRNEEYDAKKRANLIAFNSYLRIKSPDLELPPSVQHRVASFEGVARVARNMVEGQRDRDAASQLRSKALYCETLATKLKWDIWIRTYEAPIDIVELDESICITH